MKRLVLKQYIDGKNMVPKLLNEFDWDFEGNYRQYHPVMTGNCHNSSFISIGDEWKIPIETSERYHTSTYICDGNYESGFYHNAAYVCSHCYFSSNPASMKWNGEKIILDYDKDSSKGYRALRLYRRFFLKSPKVRKINCRVEKRKEVKIHNGLLHQG